MTGANPFPGPQAFPFEEDETQRKPFYGRGRETIVLLGLCDARQASLLFSPSGAGKSSLINAGLLPKLTQKRLVTRGGRQRQQQRMRYLGTARFGGQPLDKNGKPFADPGKVANPFVYLALTSLDKWPVDLEPRDVSLAEGLAQLEGDDASDGTPALLILDQFEELFTHNVEHWRQRKGFFEQLRDALEEDRDLHVLFAMREEYIAELTPYTGLLPGRLLSRFRLERLKRDAALEAVMRPAADGGREFESVEVAEELVDNLLGATESPGPLGGSEPGQFVEPLHLQIVCHQLWKELDRETPPATEIRKEHIREYADVDKSLTVFYTEALNEVLRKCPTVREYQLRDWFNPETTNIITPSKTRGLERRGDDGDERDDGDVGTTAGLPNAAVDELERAYLVRQVRRGKDIWYELAHDRLIDPILEANAAWREHLSRVTAAAERWKKNPENKKLLWSGAQLRSVRREARERAHEFSAVDREFIAACVRWQRKRRSGIGAGAAVVLLLAVLGLQIRQEGRRADEASYLQSIRLAADQLEQGRPGVADTLARAPERLRGWEWFYLESRSRFRELSPDGAESGTATIWDVDLSPAAEPPLAAIAASTGEVTLWDLATDARTEPLEACVEAESAGDRIPSVRFSADGRRLRTICRNGPTRFWDTRTKAEVPGNEVVTGFEERAPAPTGGDHPIALPADLASEPSQVALFADGEHLLTLEKTGPTSGALKIWSRSATGWARLLDLELDGDEHKAVDPGEPLVVSPDPASPHLVVSSRGRAVLWDWQAVRQQWPPGQHRLFPGAPSATPKAVFGPHGRQLLVLSKGQKTARLWDLGWLDSPVWRPPAGPRQEILLTTARTGEGLRPMTRLSEPIEARLWDFGAHDEPLASFPHMAEPEQEKKARNLPNAVALSADGSRLVVSIFEKTVVWSLRQERWQQLTLTKNAGCAAISPDGTLVVTPDPDGNRVIVWNGETGEELRRLEGHTKPVDWVAFGPRGRRVVTASQDETARVWQVESGRELFTLAGHDGGVAFAMFSPDGRRVLTGGASDGTARLWRLKKKGVQAAVLSGHGPKVRAAAISADGERIATASEASQGIIRIWSRDGVELLTLQPRPKLKSLLFDGEGRQTRLVVTSESRVEILGGSP